MAIVDEGTQKSGARERVVSWVAGIKESRMVMIYFLSNLFIAKMNKVEGSGQFVAVIGVLVAALFFIRCVSWARISRWGVFFMGFWVANAAMDSVGFFVL